MRPIGLLLVLVLGLLPRTASPQGGVPLGPEFRVNTFTTGSQSAPAVSSDIGGDFVVVWESPQDGSGNGVFGQRYSAGGVPLGPEFLANTFTTGNQFAPAATSDISGNFVVVWVSELQDGSGLGVFGQHFASSGAPMGPEFRINSFTTGDQAAPSLVVEKSGIFLVVWTSDGQDGSGLGVYGQRFVPLSTPLGPEFRINTETAADQRSPSVAATQSGTFVIAWESDGQDGSNLGVFGQRYSSSGPPQGPEFRVNTFTTGSQLAPTVAATFGTFVVVWQSPGQDGSGYGIFGQRFASSAGTPLGSEFLVNTSVAGDQSDPAAANDINGQFVVVWEDANQDAPIGNTSGIFGQRFVNTGSPAGSEFRVNTYTTGAQRHPSVATPFFGNFAVVWASDAQDGSSHGVFGQRYSMIVPVELMQFKVE
jgi:hypothetical protein